MKELTYFYLENCPFCKKANAMIDEITAADATLAAVVMNRIEESQNRELADSYDYFYVPCFFLGDQKLFEGDPSAEDIKTVLQTAANA